MASLFGGNSPSSALPTQQLACTRGQQSAGQPGVPVSQGAGPGTAAALMCAVDWMCAGAGAVDAGGREGAPGRGPRKSASFRVLGTFPECVPSFFSGGNTISFPTSLCWEHYSCGSVLIMSN